MEQRNILLIGKTGDGKSSAGNTILRKKVFTPKASASSATDEPVTGCGLVNGREITVINTPGFFDTNQDDEYTKSKIIKAMMDNPELHAIVFVLKVGRYTECENVVVETFMKLIKEEHVLKHTVILFTFGDQLDKQTLKKFIKSNSKLQEFVNKCEGRCHVIDNKYWNGDSGVKSNTVQVKNLLKTVNKMVQKNGCFTVEGPQDLGEVMEEINNMPPENKQDARILVNRTILNQVAGATAGMLISAYLGVSIFSVFVFGKPLKELLNISGSTAGAGNSTGITRAVLGASALGAGVVGGVVGGITGWKVTENSESVYNAMKKAAEASSENAKAVAEMLRVFTSLLNTE